MGITSKVLFPPGVREVSLLKNVEISFRAPSLLFNGYRGIFSRVQNSRCVKLTTNINLVPRLRISRAIRPPTLCLHGAQRNNFIFNFVVILSYVGAYITLQIAKYFQIFTSFLPLPFTSLPD